MSKKMKKVVLALALVSSFAFLTLNPTDANANQIDPKPALKPFSIGGFTLDR